LCTDLNHDKDEGNMDIGVLGGTFDPVHMGHLKIAEVAMQRLDLDRILFIPAGEPWLKVEKEITSSQHRKKMLELAIKGYPHFSISTIELERPGATYTVETLEALRAGMDSSTGIFFLMGWDSLLQLPQWKRPSKIIRMCRIVAFTRSGMGPPDLETLEEEIPGIIRSTIILDMPPVDISSSDIRDRVGKGLSIEHLVPESVEEYIRKSGLYV
jgi:nicotinate-nucleotide adenylyltransferase